MSFHGCPSSTDASRISELQQNIFNFRAYTEVGLPPHASLPPSSPLEMNPIPLSLVVNPLVTSLVVNPLVTSLVVNPLVTSLVVNHLVTYLVVNLLVL